MKIVFFDGEMSNLSPDYGQLLCGCAVEWKNNGDHPWQRLQTFTLDWNAPYHSERELLMQFRTALEEPDIVVSYNGIKFDVPFINARLKKWGLRPMRLQRHKDLLYTVRYKLGLSSSRLANVADFLRLHQKYGVEKTPMEGEMWTRATVGHLLWAYRYIVTHCQRDVRVLACAYHELREEIRWGDTG